MCGIAGIIAENPEVARAALAAMVGAQTHRGPDDQGQEVSAVGSVWLGLGQRRLSILDLSPAGHQPMIHPETGDQIVFNGEIYNFQTLRGELEAAGTRFRGHSDTEVLLHALARWGPDCIGRLEGMFAFAWFRCRDSRLLLARDPMGIKPLYAACLPHAFLFASEIRAIRACGLAPFELDRQAVAGFFAYGSVPEPLTIDRNIRSFPAGGWQWFDAHTPRQELANPVHRHWDYPGIQPDGFDETSVLPLLRETLDAAVRDHLVSDVPVGVFLSAGIDSTIMTGLAARHTPQLRTFTVGFSDQPELSESSLAAGTARQFQTAHTDIQINGVDAQSMALRWLDSLDQPSVDGLNTYVISKAVRDQGIVVALSGLGGDELFGGYSSFSRVPRMLQMAERLNWLPRWGRSALTSVATIGRPSAVKQKAVDIARTQGTLVELYLQYRRAMSDAQLAALGLDRAALGLTPSFLTDEALSALDPRTRDQVAAVSRLESQFYMRNVLLRDSDTNGMAHSLEIRVPLLDHRMLDLAHSIPAAVRLPDAANNKHLLRRAFSDLLRPELNQRAKTGFELPIAHWIAGPMREMCESAMAHLAHVLDPAGVKAIWNDFVAGGDRTRYTRAFALCVLGHYLQRMGT